MTKKHQEKIVEQLFNVQNAASFLDVNPNTIRKWAQQGKLQGLKIGSRGDWRFTKEDLSKIILSHHISSRKQVKAVLSQQKVEENERNLKIALEAGKMGAWQLDIIHDTATRSLGHDQLFGYKTLLPKWGIKIFMQHVAPDDYELVQQAFQNAFKTGELHFDCRISRADKKSAWIHVRGQVFYEKKMPVLMAGVVMDITERKRAEEALAESEARFRALVTATSYVVYRMSPDWYEMRELQGRKFLADTGKPIRNWLKKYIHPNDQNHVLEVINNAIRSKSVFQLEHQVIQANGSLGWTFSRAIPILDEYGEIVEWFGAASDVTDRRQSEELLRESEGQYGLLIENVRDYCMFTSDLKGIITSWNPGVEKILGYSEDEFIGNYGSLIFTPEDKKINRFEKEMNIAFSSGRAEDTRWHMRKNGTRFFAEGVATLVKDNTGRPIGFAKIFRDITERKAYEQQKDDFMGIVSHELKTPVTSVKAFTQVLQSRFIKAGDEKSTVLLGKMDAQINKLTALIGDLLDVTKIEGGKLQFNEDFFYFDELVEEIVEETQRTTNIHKIEIVGKTKKTTFGDKVRIGQVLINMLTNAIKYSPHADKILVKTSADTKQVKVCVQDFGVGIPKEKQGKIFERFYRVNDSAHNTVPGIGLGMYIASEIVRRQKGTIWLESEQGKGSTFCFNLPIQKQKIKQQKNTSMKEKLKYE